MAKDQGEVFARTFTGLMEKNDPKLVAETIIDIRAGRLK